MNRALTFVLLTTSAIALAQSPQIKNGSPVFPVTRDGPFYPRI
jgi:hypothetical protein